MAAIVDDRLRRQMSAALGGLRGREAEADVIAALLGRVRSGCGTALVIRGEAGIGKTALLGLAERAATDITVLRATAIETEAELPFAGLHLLLRPVLGLLPGIAGPQARTLERAFGLAAWPPPPGSSPGDEPRPDDLFLAGLAALSLLTEATGTRDADGPDAVTAGGAPCAVACRPVLCLVDDAQWLDSASATALLFAARRLDADGVAVILAMRDNPGLVQADGFPELRLGPLPDEAARQMLRDVLDDQAVTLDPQLGERVLADAAGNPLAIAELARVAGQSPARGQHGRPGPLPAGERIQRLYGRQVAGLPDATRMLLLVAAAGPGELDLVLAAGRSLGLAGEALAPAEQSRLVTVADGTVAFRHPLVRAAVYHDAPLARRQAVHRALAGALAVRGAAAAHRRAWHLASAAAGHDDVAAAELATAAEQARQVSSHAAAVAYERAAELTTDPETRARRLLAAAGAATDTGQSAQAGRLLRAADGLIRDPVLRAEAAYLRSRGYGAGHVESVRALASAVDDIAESHQELAARMLRVLVVSARNTGQAELSAAAATRLESLTAAAPALARQVAAGPHERLIAGLEAWRRGDHATALRMSAELAAECRDRGMLNWLTGALHCQGLAETASGNWAAARATLTEAHRLAADIGQPVRVAHSAALLATLAAAEGDEAACQEWLTGYAKDDASGDAWAYGTALPAMINVSLGRFGTALTQFRALRADGARPDGARPDDDRPPGKWLTDTAFWYQPDIVEAAARATDPGWAAAAATAFRDWAAGTGQPWARAVAARCLGLASQPAEQEPWFREALSLHDRSDANGRPFEAARTRLVYGEWLRRERRRTAAAEQLSEAARAFDTLGATAWGRRARRELAATGQAAARATAPGTLARLTPQEYQIVTLAAGGLSNREIAARLFLSHRTVGYHLYKAYPKLHITQRAELSGLIVAAQQGDRR
jgi:DNA-binding CsgD family transcriptional regulator